MHIGLLSNWDKALSTGKICSYAAAVSILVSSLLNSTCEDSAHLNQEILYVCNEICNLAKNLLPKYSDKEKRHRNFFRDEQLKQLCKTSKSAWKEWKYSGRPTSGKLFEKKKTI